MTDVDASHRGRTAVERALIEATAALLAEQGPARVGVREIAERAGVNKGQIHHYFGGKQGLVEAAVRKLAHDHFAGVVERTGGPVPEALALRDDVAYWQVLVRLILDGDLATASLEFGDGVSVPRNLLGLMTEAEGLDAPSTELKARLVGAMAIELGWAAFGDFILEAVQAGGDETEAITERLRTLVEDTVTGVS